ncbi:MAG: hypothetical protein K1X83_00975 [Oligoflexia bacterium]|nr:hypothetical protein [Oligoflexia bacterium]
MKLFCARGSVTLVEFVVLLTLSLVLLMGFYELSGDNGPAAQSIKNDKQMMESCAEKLLDPEANCDGGPVAP